MKSPLDTKPLGVEIPEGMLTSRKTILQLACVVGIGLTFWIWFGIFGTHNILSTLYVLDVGQGDSQLVVLGGDNGMSAIKILIDGGRDKTVLTALDTALGNLNTKYLDLVILTHTDLDHLGGLIEVARRYDIGMFISSGRETTSDAYRALQEVLAERAVPTIVLLEGDAIRYGESSLTILSPDRTLLEHKEVNESGIVAMLRSEDIKVLFTADIGRPAEDVLMKKKYDLTADILKVGHHGSGNSSSEKFIASVRPTVSVIGVGTNSYGHPTARVLESLALAGSRVYRTDENRTIKIPLQGSGESSQTSAPRTGFLAAVASIMTGEYKDAGLTMVSLQQARDEKNEFKLVPYEECSFSSAGTPLHSPIIINEVAWMGSVTGPAHEWIELKNVSPKSVNMSGWQLLNANERLRITFPQKLTFDSPYMILARSAVSAALGFNANLIFTGSLRNGSEGLRLYDNECNLIDEVPVSSEWPAGDNASKQTMERMKDLSWSTSQVAGGTPNKENTSKHFPSAPVKSPPIPAKTPSQNTSCAAGQINLNTASRKELVNIRHIGEVRADDIIAKRPFASLTGLRGKVAGIGEVRLADIIAEGKACVE